MDDEIAIFEKFFRTETLEVPELVECVQQHLYNSLAPATVAYPHAVFTVVPLNDNTGQARTSIQTRLLVDLKILSILPMPPTISPAVAAVKEHYRGSFTYDFEGYRISVRHERPIAYSEPGSTPDEKIFNRGATFRVWMSKVPA